MIKTVGDCDQNMAGLNQISSRALTLMVIWSRSVYVPCVFVWGEYRKVHLFLQKQEIPCAVCILTTSIPYIMQFSNHHDRSS